MDDETVELAAGVESIGCPYIDDFAQRADALGVLLSRIQNLPPDSEIFQVALEMSRALIGTIPTAKPTRLSVVK